MSVVRKFKRDQLRKKIGSNKIQPAWERNQIEAYGFRDWWDMRVDCDSKKRRAVTLCE
jgi:hypothetical protein